MSGRGGRRAGAGRPKGRVADETADIKAMVVGALSAVGGVDYLARQAEQNPVAFMGLVGKVLPLQLAGHDGGRLEVEFRWKDDSPVINSVATEVSTEPDDDAPTISFIGEC